MEVERKPGRMTTFARLPENITPLALAEINSGTTLPGTPELPFRTPRKSASGPGVKKNQLIPFS